MQNPYEKNTIAWLVFGLLELSDLTSLQRRLLSEVTGEEARQNKALYVCPVHLTEASGALTHKCTCGKDGVFIGLFKTSTQELKSIAEEVRDKLSQAA